MKEFPDKFNEHVDKYIKKATKRYEDAVLHGGLEPTPRLTRAIVERALTDAEKSYTEEIEAEHNHNIQMILMEHKRNMKSLDRDGARQALYTCPPITAFFSFIAWYSFNQSHDTIIGITFSAGALAFLIMLIIILSMATKK